MADITVLQHLESKEQSQAVRNKMLGLSPNIVDATAVTAPRQRFLVVVAGVNNEKYIFQQVAQSLVEVWRPWCVLHGLELRLCEVFLDFNLGDPLVLFTGPTPGRVFRTLDDLQRIYLGARV
jgi:hypothetical protein